MDLFVRKIGDPGILMLLRNLLLIFQRWSSSLFTLAQAENGLGLLRSIRWTAAFALDPQMLLRVKVNVGRLLLRLFLR